MPRLAPVMKTVLLRSELMRCGALSASSVDASDQGIERVERVEEDLDATGAVHVVEPNLGLEAPLQPLFEVGVIRIGRGLGGCGLVLVQSSGLRLCLADRRAPLD